MTVTLNWEIVFSSNGTFGAQKYRKMHRLGFVRQDIAGVWQGNNKDPWRAIFTSDKLIGVLLQPLAFIPAMYPLAYNSKTCKREFTKLSLSCFLPSQDSYLKTHTSPTNTSFNKWNWYFCNIEFIITLISETSKITLIIGLSVTWCKIFLRSHLP